MVLVKWSAIIFIGLSAMFMTDVRASSLSDLLSDARVTQSMRANLVAAARAANVDIGISSDLLSDKDRLGALERMLVSAADPAFAKTLGAFRVSCRMKISEIGFNHFFHSSVGTLYFSTSNPDDMIDAMSRSAADCAKVYNIADQAAPRVAPYKLKFEADDLTNGNVRVDDLLRWMYEFRDGKTVITLLQNLSTSCRVPLKEILLRSNERLYGGGIELRANDFDDEKFVKHFTDTIDQCQAILPALSDFNRTTAIPRGMAFKLDPANFLEGKYTADNVRSWINFFNDDPGRIGAFRELLFKSQGFIDYRRDNPLNTAKMIVPAEFVRSIGVSIPGALAQLWTAVIGAPVLVEYLNSGAVQQFGEAARDFLKGFDGVLNARLQIPTAETPHLPDSL